MRARTSPIDGAFRILFAGLGLVAAPAAPAAAQHAPPPAETGPAEEAAKAPRRKWEDLELPPLRPFAPPRPERVEIDGMTVFLLEDHELPTIDLVALVRTGEIYETRDKAGLASICGEVMRTGGTIGKTGDQIDEELESMAASVEVSIGLWQARAGVSALKESFGPALDVLVDVLTRPAFRDEKIALAKSQRKSAIARRNDEPGEIASRELARALYGDASPYGWTEEVATIDAIEKKDLLDFHRRFFARDRTLIGVVGDFDAKEMAALLAKKFSVYPKSGGDPLPPAPAVGEGAGRAVYLVDKRDVNQSTVLLGHLAIQRRPDDPDYPAAVVADTILGSGGFAARLLQRVRTDMGLAYSVYSRLDAPYSHRGTFFLGCQTKSETTVKAIEAMLAELARMVAEPPSAKELEVAKESILQSLIFAVEKRSDVIERALRYEYYGFPQDYLERFQEGIARVTAADVQRAAKKVFRPERLTVIVVGNAAAFDGPLDRFGRVTALDVARPAWPKETALQVATPEEREAAAAVVARALEAHGGRAVLEAVKGYRAKGQMKVAMGEQSLALPVEALVAFPDRLKVTMMSPAGMVVQCLDGTKVWVQVPSGVHDGSPADVAKVQDMIDGSPVRILLAAAKEAALAGDGEVGGRPTRVVRSGRRTLHFDAETGRLVRAEHGNGMATVFSDFRPVAGALLPFKHATEGGPAPQELVLDELVVNPEIAPGAFSKPEAPKTPEQRTP